MSMVVGREAPTTPGCLKKLLKTRSMASHGHWKVCVFNLNPNIWFFRKIQIRFYTFGSLCCRLCCSSQCTSCYNVLQQIAHQLPHQCSPSCNIVQLFFALVWQLVQSATNCHTSAKKKLHCVAARAALVWQLVRYLLQHIAAASALPAALRCSRYPRG